MIQTLIVIKETYKQLPRLSISKERDTCLKRSYLRDDLLTQFTSDDHDRNELPCLSISKEQDTCLKRSYSRDDLLTQFTSDGHDKWNGKNQKFVAGVSTLVGVPLILPQRKWLPQTTHGRVSKIVEGWHCSSQERRLSGGSEASRSFCLTTTYPQPTHPITYQSYPPHFMSQSRDIWLSRPSREEIQHLRLW